jgi:formylglycine-generating enzyme required for sulfatase activity
VLEWGVFVALGDPPPATGLLPLGGADATRQRAIDAFGAYLDPSAWSSASLDELPTRENPGVVYLFGHAWLSDHSFTVAASATRLIGPRELIEHLVVRVAGPVLLIVDTCHAAALRPVLRELRLREWTVLLASDADESAFSFSGAGSRMSLALVRAARRLRTRRGVDALDLYYEVRKQLAGSEVVAAQSVGYWVDGEALTLMPKPTPDSTRLPQPHVWARALFVMIGSVFAMAVIRAASYYYEHALVEIRVSRAVLAMTEGARITIHRADLDSGEEEGLRNVLVPASGVLNLRVPVGNLILRFNGSYEDQQPRALNLHVLTAPGWQFVPKRIRWPFPDESQVREHAGMAYVPPVHWLRGVSREPAIESRGFWIDLHPPKTGEYTAWMREAVAQGDVDAMQTQIGSTRARVGGLKSMGLDVSLGQLMQDLEPALRQIDETVRRDAREPQSAQIATLEESCENCPALMTRDEADRYCAGRGLRVPTRSEWELAVRGVDGRAYPWGNRFVRGRANVVGLPEKGQEYELAAVDAFKEFRSPFGLWDTVGNAGDWVDTQGGYPRAFAGGNYRFNPEDVTVVSLLPDTGEIASVWPNTSRCVAPAG